MNSLSRAPAATVWRHAVSAMTPQPRTQPPSRLRAADLPVGKD